MRPLPALSTLVAPDNDHLPRSGRLAFSFARLRASFGLAANPRTRRQDASNSLLQPTFRATSTHDKHHLWRLPIEHRGKPASVRYRDRLLDCRRSWRSRFPRATPDHLAVIRTSNSSAFDDASPASGRSAVPFQRFWRQVGEKLRRFVGLRELRRIEPSDTSRGRLCVVRFSRPRGLVA